MKLHITSEDKRDLKFVLDNLISGIEYPIIGNNIALTLQEEYRTVLQDAGVSVYKNPTNDIEYDYILIYKQAEVGLVVLTQPEYSQGCVALDNILYSVYGSF